MSRKRPPASTLSSPLAYSHLLQRRSNSKAWCRKKATAMTFHPVAFSWSTASPYSAFHPLHRHLSHLMWRKRENLTRWRKARLTMASSSAATGLILLSTKVPLSGRKTSRRSCSLGAPSGVPTRSSCWPSTSEPCIPPLQVETAGSSWVLRVNSGWLIRLGTPSSR